MVDGQASMKAMSGIRILLFFFSAKNKHVLPLVIIIAIVAIDPLTLFFCNGIRLGGPSI